MTLKSRCVNYWVSDFCGIVKEAEERDRKVTKDSIQPGSFQLQVTESCVVNPYRIVGIQQDWSRNLAGSELSLCHWRSSLPFSSVGFLLFRFILPAPV